MKVQSIIHLISLQKFIELIQALHKHLILKKVKITILIVKYHCSKSIFFNKAMIIY